MASVLWFQGGACSGNTMSFLNADEPNVVDLINAGEIDIVVNTPSGGIARADGYEIRAAAVAADKALFTTMAVLGAAVSALPVLRSGFAVRSLQEYAQDRAERLAGAGR